MVIIPPATEEVVGFYPPLYLRMYGGSSHLLHVPWITDQGEICWHDIVLFSTTNAEWRCSP